MIFKSTIQLSQAQRRFEAVLGTGGVYPLPGNSVFSQLQSHDWNLNPPLHSKDFSRVDGALGAFCVSSAGRSLFKAL